MAKPNPYAREALRMVKALRRGDPKAASKVKKTLLGAILRWEDKDPLAERAVVSSVITHRVAVHKLLFRELYLSFSEDIFQKTRLHWKVTMRVFFEPKDGETRTPVEVIELKAHCCLAEINDTVCEELELALSEMRATEERTSTNTIFEVECVGV